MCPLQLYVGMCLCYQSHFLVCRVYRRTGGNKQTGGKILQKYLSEQEVLISISSLPTHLCIKAYISNRNSRLDNFTAYVYNEIGHRDLDYIDFYE